MSNTLVKPRVYVAKTQDNAWHVYAARTYQAGEIIEQCPVVLCFHFENQLQNYLLNWHNHWCLPLGMGAIYSRAKQGSCQWFPDYDRKILVIMAKQTIQPGEPVLLDEEPTLAADLQRQKSTTTHKSHQYGVLSVLAMAAAAFAFVVLRWLFL